jgi:hypothetical protein
MQHTRDLTPCLIGTGTVSGLRDMVRAMETVEAFEYRYAVDGEGIAEGRATLVKIMADPDSSTLLVNGCLFLNVASFRYLNFTTADDGDTAIELYGDGVVLELRPVEDPEGREGRPVMRFMEDPAFDTGSFVALDDEEDED